MAANMWKNSLKNAEFDNNKVLYATLLHLFLQQNGTYFLNKPRIKIRQLGLLCKHLITAIWLQYLPGMLSKPQN